MSPSNWANLAPLEVADRPSIVWESDGDAGSGKSFFGLTAPDPMWVAAFDPYGMNRVDKSLKVGRDIRISRYPFDPRKYKNQQDVKKHATEIWLTFLADYEAALPNVRTVLWDREDMTYKLQRYTNWGDTSAAPKEYEDLTIEYTGLIQEANRCGVNLGLLRGLKEKWVSKFDASKGKMVGGGTGEMIPDGMQKLRNYVDITLAHRWDVAQREYIVKIGKFTTKEEREMEYPNLTFTDMAMLAYPETCEEDWK